MLSQLVTLDGLDNNMEKLILMSRVPAHTRGSRFGRVYTGHAVSLVTSVRDGKLWCTFGKSSKDTLNGGQYRVHSIDFLFDLSKLPLKLIDLLQLIFGLSNSSLLYELDHAWKMSASGRAYNYKKNETDLAGWLSL